MSCKVFTHQARKPIIYLSLNIKMTPEAGVNVVCFPLVAGETKGLQVADIICTTTGKGDDMVDSKVSFLVSFPAALAMVFIALVYVYPHFFWDGNSRSFAHYLVSFIMRRISSRGDSGWVVSGVCSISGSSGINSTLTLILIFPFCQPLAPIFRISQSIPSPNQSFSH